MLFHVQVGGLLVKLIFSDLASKQLVCLSHHQVIQVCSVFDTCLGIVFLTE